MGRVRISLMLILCVLLFGVTGSFLPSAFAEGSGTEALVATGAVGGLRDDPVDPPDISFDPASIEADLYTGGRLDTIVTVTNDNNNPINFTLEGEITQEGRDGPRRDEAGDLLGQFQGINAQNQYSSCIGWDWDNERMWVTNYISSTAAAYTHDANYQNFEEMIRINPGSCMDGCWAQGLLFLPNFGSNVVNRYDADGQNVGAINFPWGVYGLAADLDNGWLFAQSSNDMNIYVYPLDGEGGVDLNQQLGVINNHGQFHGNQQVYGLEWVSKHADGQLWMTSPQDRLVHQIAVDVNDWTCTGEVQAFQVFPGADQPYSSVAHDGKNLWASGYANATIRVYDDGVSEMYWFMYSPTEGQIAAGASQEITITLDAFGLNAGTYRAILHFLSDDQGQPDAEVEVVMNVEGAPDINVTWSEDWGYPDVVDWNRRYADLFSGGPYTMPVTISNEGTDDLSIDAISIGHGYFTPDAEQFVLGPGESRDVTITFNAPADDPGVYEPDLTIDCNDPDEASVDVALHAEAFLPPVMILDRNAYQTALTTGETDDFVINIANDGDAVLRWTSDIQIMQEGRRDNSGRNVRSLDGSVGPNRDDAGDLLGQFQGINQAQSYCSPVGWDWDNERMWVTSYNNSIAAAYTHDADYQNFEEVLRINCGNNMDGCWADGYLMLPTSLGQAQVNRWDAEGQNVGAINFNFGVYGLAWDMDNDWLFALSSERDAVIHVFQLDGEGNLGEELGVIQNHAQYHGNVQINGIEWVSQHPDGQLWFVNHNDQNAYEIAVNTDDWTCTETVQTFRVLPGGDQMYNSCAHDGVNMWVAGWGPNTIRVYDDGVQEIRWISIDPTEGSLQAGADQNVNVHLDSFGLITGEYIADIHIISNDPADPDQVCTVTLDVTGAPDIDVTWAEGAGFPQAMNWNSAVPFGYADELYAGGPYPMALTIENVGTDTLDISDVSSDIGAFTTNWDPQTQGLIAPDGKIAIIVTMEVNEPDDWAGTLTIVSNDGDEERVDVRMIGTTTNPPILTLSTNEVNEEMVTGDVISQDVEIGNDGAAILRFVTDLSILQEGGRDADSRSIRSLDGAAPSRDEAGDLLGQFNGINVANDYCSPIGWDWDNERMWVTRYNQQVVVAYTHDANYENFEEVARINCGNNMDGCWADGYLFIPTSLGQAQVNRWDADGQNIGAINFGFGVYGLAWDMENEWLFVLSSNDWGIHVFQLDGEGNIGDQIGVIGQQDHQQFHGNQLEYGMEWVSKHPDGQLWFVNYVDANIYQIAVDTDDWTCIETVQRFPVLPGQDQPYTSSAHDGHNMWVAGYGPATIRIYDDGTTEAYWVLMEPKEGEIQPGGSIMGAISLDAAGLITGRYIADVLFISNDPVHPLEEPDAAIRVTIDVRGVPNMDVTPGGDEAEEPPADFGIVYYDYPESIDVVVENVGTEDLELNDVASDQDNPDFYVNGDDLQGFVLAPAEKRNLAVHYNPDQQRGDGEHTATLIFSSNDPRYPDGYPVRVVGNAMVRPILALEVNAIDRELNEGESEEVTVDVGNDGGSQLNWTAEIEIIGQPGRDEASRSVRSLDGSTGPRRDDPGELLGEFQGVNQANIYCSPVGWDWDNERMWVTQYNNAFAVAYTHDARYENFEEVLRIQCGNNMDGCWADGYLFLPTGLGSAQVNRWDSDGQNIGAINFGFGVYGLGADLENEWLFVISSNDQNIHVFQLDGEGGVAGGELGVINNHAQFHNNAQALTMEWVAKHTDGQLWMLDSNTGLVYEIAVDTDEWTCTEAVQNFRVMPQGDQPWSSVAHDGHNLWAAGYANATIRVYDDGVFEAYWLSMDPMEGTLEAGSSENVTIALNTIGNIGGRYAADIHFLSNDPANPDQVIAVTLLITGQSVFGSDPVSAPFSEEPNIMFPVAYDGFETAVDVTFTNVGSGVYTVNGFNVDGDNPDDFGIAMNEPFELNSRVDTTVVFYFRPNATGARHARLHLDTDANNVEGQDVYWDLTGICLLPPSIYTRPENGIPRVNVRTGGDPVDASLVIGNAEGQDRDTLTYRIYGIAPEQDRDAGGRAIRSLTDAPVGPRRDVAGDSIARFDVNHYGAFGISRDYENDVMWVNACDQRGAVTNFWTGYQWDGDQITGVVTDFEVNMNGTPLLGGVYYDGVLYASRWDGQNNLMRFDVDGNDLGNLAVGNDDGSRYLMACAIDAERGYLFVTSLYDANFAGRVEVHVLDVNNDFAEIGLIQNFMGQGNNADFRGRLTWVPEHRNGHLWATWQFRAYQLRLNEEDWTTEVVQDFAVTSDVRSPGIANDGRNMWIGNNITAPQITIWDDGISEGPEWLVIDPTKGALLGGEEAEITLTCSPGELADGVYEGRVLVKSNDPGNPEIYLGISMEVSENGPQMQHFAGYDAANFPNGWHVTGTDHSVLVNNVVWDDNVGGDGWEIGVFTPGGVLAGGSIWNGGDPVGIAVYGAEGDIAQFADGETMSFKVWDNQADVEHFMAAEVNEGTLDWTGGGFTAVTLTGRSVYTCVVPFQAGWNLISINITPAQNLWNANGPDVRLMMAQLRVDANHHHVILMKNERGNFYAPANNNFNNIPFWNTAEGYQVRMDEAIEGRWTGVKIDDQADVPISAGWNMIAYFPTYQLTCARNSFTAISSVVDNVVLTKDGFGHFASPRNNFSNMDPWREGRGYQINVDASITLNYPVEQQNAAAIKVGESDASVVGRWTEPAITGANMSVLVTGIKGVELASDDQVAAFSADGRLVGVGRVTDGMVGLAVWGDDASTEAVDGLQNGEAFMLKLWDADKDAVVDLRMEGLVYETDAFTAADAVAGAVIPNAYSLGQNFPNPFNAVTRLAFGLPEASRVSIRVFDVAGREVATLVSGNLEAGNHTAVWSAEGFNSGVYLVKMETPAFSATRKVMLVK